VQERLLTEMLGAVEPLVASGPAYTELAADRADRMKASLGFHDEAKKRAMGLVPLEGIGASSLKARIVNTSPVRSVNDQPSTNRGVRITIALPAPGACAPSGPTWGLSRLVLAKESGRPQVR
jgi:hypothetical protein